MILSTYKLDGTSQLGKEGGFLLIPPLRERLQFEFNPLLETKELEYSGRRTGRKPWKSQTEPTAF